MGAQKVERAMAALAESAKQQAHWTGESLRFTRNRGDGWQAVVHHPEGALRSALAFRASLKQLDAAYETYISIATGPAPAEISDDLNEMNAPIFVRSGRQLDLLKDRAHKDGVLIADWNWSCAASTAILADCISQDWTPAQAAAMLLYLNPYSDELTYTDAAEQLGKSRQVITKSLKAAKKDAILKALFLLESALRAAPQSDE
ncbi:MAG: hypothetical protein P8X77_02560 [Maritimibacter sp.]